MAHLKVIDGDKRTVLMVQVENEIGMLPSARDHSAAAEADFKKPVPAAVLKATGKTGSGSWEQVFGKSDATDELYQAWTFGRFVEAVASAGLSAADVRQRRPEQAGRSAGRLSQRRSPAPPVRCVARGGPVGVPGSGHLLSRLHPLGGAVRSAGQSGVRARGRPGR
jgi:hypothetical protein